MAPGSRQGALRSNKITLAAKVAAPQDELDQLTHRNRMDWLGNRRHAGSFMPQPACGNRIVGDDAPALLKKAWSGRQNSVESSVMTETPQRLPLALRSIAIFEAAKGALALAAGCGLLSLRHTDLHAVADAFLLHHGIDPETHYRRLFIESVARATDQHTGQIVALAFAYALIRLVEGYGLWQGKHWAEWFAVISAGLYLPLELHHLARRPTLLTMGVLLFNIAIMGYLGKLLVQQRARRRGSLSDEPEPP